MTAMKTRALIGVLVLAVLVGIAGCTQGQSSTWFRFRSATPLGQTIPVADRKPTPGFTGTLLGGGTATLTEYAGKIVLANFWAAWCSPCQVEAPQLDLVYRQTRSAGVQVLGIDTKDQAGSAESFVQDNRISYPNFYDEQGKAAISFGNVPAAGLPFSVLFDKHQRVAAVYLGPVTPKDLEPVFHELETEP